MADGMGGRGVHSGSYAVGTVALGVLAVLGPVRGGAGPVSPLIRVRERRTRRHGV